MSTNIDGWVGMITSFIGGGGVSAVLIKWLSVQGKRAEMSEAMKNKRDEAIDKKYDMLIDDLRSSLTEANATISRLQKGYDALRDKVVAQATEFSSIQKEMSSRFEVQRKSDAIRIEELERKVIEQQAHIERLEYQVAQSQKNIIGGL